MPGRSMSDGVQLAGRADDRDPRCARPPRGSQGYAMSDTSDLTYEQGYTEGESNHHADWDFALDELLPDGVEAWPTQVRDYIRRLQDDAILAGILRRAIAECSDLDWSTCAVDDEGLLVADCSLRLSDAEADAIRRVRKP
jgi:hypothetical protein